MPAPPSPSNPAPIPAAPSVAFLAPLIRNTAKIAVGDYTYVHAFGDVTRWEEAAVRYAFDFIDDRLEIGKFCAIADGAVFILNGGNHHTETIATYPFSIFGEAWAAAAPAATGIPFPNKGGVAVGHDVWIGHEARVLPGVTIGSGAVIGSQAVVTKDVAPYAIVAGNPAREIRKRFTDAEIETLLALAWWDRDIDWITEHVGLIAGEDIAALATAAGVGPAL